jgi:MFS family permease
VTDPLAVLRRILASPDLRRLFLAALAFAAAEYGTWVAILLYAFERTGAASVGFVAVLQLVPAALVAPAAAGLGDRFPRQRVLTGGYLVQSLAMLGTAAAMLADAPIAVIYLAATVAASSLVVTRPTQSALLPSLSRTPDELTAANGAAGVIEGAGVLLGPLAAAAILVGSTPGTVFAIGGVALLLAALLTLGLRPVVVLPAATLASSDETVVPDPDTRSAGFLDGLRAVVADPDARLVVGLLSARMVMIGAADVLFVLMALQVLHTGDSGAGILNAALGAGTILGGAATFVLVGRTGLAMVAAVGALAWGIALGLSAILGSAALAPVLIVGGGAGLAIVDVAGRTILQRSVRDNVLSRVFGLQEGLAMAGLAVGSVLVPLLVTVLPLVTAIVVLALVLPVVVVLSWPRLSALDRRVVIPTRAIGVLRRNQIFRSLPAPQLEAVARGTMWLTVAAGTVLIREGDAGDRFYVVSDGAVAVTQGGRPVRELRALGDGFGEIALIRDVPRTATVTTLTDSVLLAIDRGPFLAAVTGHAGSAGAADRVMEGRAG